MRLPLVIAATLLLTAAHFSSVSSAQTPDSQVVSSWLEPVKLDDGTETTHRYEITFDYGLNQATLAIYDEAGTRIETRATDPPPTPHPDEKAEGRALILADPELAAVIEGIDDPVVEGGFVLYEGACREVRCLQFTISPADASRLERFVIVDLSSRSILERDLYPHLRD